MALNRRSTMERLNEKSGKVSSYYGERRNASVSMMPSGQGRNIAPVSDLLSLFDSHKKKTGSIEHKNGCAE